MTQAVRPSEQGPPESAPRLRDSRPADFEAIHAIYAHHVSHGLSSFELEAPGFERRGIGHALLEGLIERCTGLGYRRMVAVIGDRGNQASIRLHEEQGFERAGLIPSVGFKLDRWVDVVILQRP